MLTFFTIPKPFHGYLNIIQTNSIQSWLRLYPECEIILFGNNDGIDETASRFGLKHVPVIERNSYGTPLLNSIFDKAQDLATHRLVCYVNTDIILMNDFIEAVQRIRKKHFLMVGQRWNIDLKDEIDFKSIDWDIKLRKHVYKVGEPLGEGGIDYFVFPKGLLTNIPPFAIGRS